MSFVAKRQHWPERAIALAILAILSSIPGRLFAQDANKSSDAKTPAEDPSRSGTTTAITAKPAEPQIVIADHVILWDDRIMTWNEVVLRLRLLRHDGPIHPTFITTHGILSHKEENWQFWHDRIMKLYVELFQPAGLSFTTTTLRGSKIYDAIETEADLRPDPALTHKGKVLQSDGQSAARAQIVLLPINDNSEVVLQGTRIRDPYNERWSLTDDHGRFTVYPCDEEFYILALHPKGFALQRASRDSDRQLTLELNLQPWSIVKFISTGEVADQLAQILCKPNGAGQDWPTFSIFEIKPQATPVSVYVPPGQAIVYCSSKAKLPALTSMPDMPLSLQPGEERSIEIKPPIEDQRTRPK